MKSLSILAVMIGVGFLFLGIFARSPEQAALSNAVIAIGVAMLLFVGIIAAITHFSKRGKSQSGS